MSPTRLATRRKRVPQSSLEPLEARIAPATFLVTTTADSGAGSLRQAILDANASPGGDSIMFQIPETGPIIHLLSALPKITDQVSMMATASPAPTILGLDTGGSDGLVLSGAGANGSFIYGLEISGFSGLGLVIQGSDHNTIADMTIGVGPGSSSGNHGGGIRLENANDNQIGGAKWGGVISGNGEDGIFLINSSGNSILENKIGTDSTGLKAVPNAGAGITIEGGANNVIGAVNVGNVISGNAGDGIQILDSTGAIVKSNIIGLGINGVTNVQNGGNGIKAQGGSPPIVGGTATGEGNVISGNRGAGVSFLTLNLQATGSAAFYIQGNLIGTDKNGSVQFSTITGSGARVGGTGNYNQGILIENSPLIGIGGTTASARNVISGNGSMGTSGSASNVDAYGGVVLYRAMGTVVSGNYIGTDAAGAKAAGNLNDGIRIIGGSATIGGNTAGARNVISANGLASNPFEPDNRSGITVSGSGGNSPSLTILGNYIGTDATGTQDLGNYLDGVRADNTVVGGPVVIGGTTAAAGNVISGNGGFGIRLGLDMAGTTQGVNGVSVGNNFIGTNAQGTGAIPNDAGGIEVAQRSGAIEIGQIFAGQSFVPARNIISGNTGPGVVLEGTTSDVNYNYIGVDVTGNKALGNRGGGVVDSGVNPYFKSHIYLNVISGNGFGTGNGTGAGVLISGAGVYLQGNIVGLSANKQAALGNAGDGINVAAGVYGVLIGPTDLYPNYVGGNGGDGIEVNSAGVQVYGNYLGTTDAGTAVFPNKGSGVLLKAGAMINGNTIGNNAGDGVDVEAGGNGAEIEGNTIFGQKLYGINVSGVTGKPPTIFGNVIGLGVNGRVEVGNLLGGINLDGTVAMITGRNVISGNRGPGITVNGAPDGTVIQGNYIGTDRSGNFDVTASGKLTTGNAGQGILVNGGGGVTIGGATAGAGNVIAGNGSFGFTPKIPLYGGIVLIGAESCLIAGNYVGTDATGAVAAGNAGDGIRIDGSEKIVIGGSTTLARNVISANGAEMFFFTGDFINGISVTGNSIVEISGNYIGTDVTGTKALGNKRDGIMIGAANGKPDDILIGGTTTAEGNVISGNGRMGIMVGEPDVATNSMVTGVAIGNNFIGTDATGNAALGNYSGGVWLGLNSTVTSVGAILVNGQEKPARNIISGNGGAGIMVDGSNEYVENNFVGVDVTGQKALGNLENGVEITGNSSAAWVKQNVISGNGFGTRGALTAGVSVSGDGSFIAGNTIGLNVDRTAALGNAGAGIAVALTSPFLDVQIGVVDLPNVIGGNGGDGIAIQGTGAAGIGIEANMIGTYQGHAFPNAGAGIAIAQAQTIKMDVEGNLIADNQGAGIALQMVRGAVIVSNRIIGNGSYGIDLNGSTDAFIQSNVIGVDESGAPVPNGAGGIRVSQSSATIGGSNAGEGNTIAGNNGVGIMVVDSPVGSIIYGNYIGGSPTIDPESGAAHLIPAGNTGAGIWVKNSPYFAIGGNAETSRNVISWNGGAGIVIEDSHGGGAILRNYVGTDLGGMENPALLPSGNVGQGILVLQSTGVTIGNNVVAGTRAGVSALTPLNGGVVLSDANNCQVYENYIGTDATGSVAFGNVDDGIRVDGGSGNVIGGFVKELGNLVSGNGVRSSDGGSDERAGISVSGGASVTIDGNFIGTDLIGTKALGNFGNGIQIESSGPGSGVHGVVLIGGDDQDAGNVISGNGGDGVVVGWRVQATDGFNYDVQLGNNLVGTDVSGEHALGNAGNGVTLTAATTGVRVGRLVVDGVETSAGNVISGNHGNGLVAEGSGHLIADNHIGADFYGFTVLGNWQAGAVIGGATHASNVRVLDNVISSNRYEGEIGYFPGLSLDGEDLTISGNTIGVDYAGGMSVQNGGPGIELKGEAVRVHIGWSSTTQEVTEQNIISGNLGEGIVMDSPDSQAVTIEGNLIGSRGLGGQNGGGGIHIKASSAGSVLITGNVIGGDGGAEVSIENGGYATVTHNEIFGGNMGIDLGADGPTPNDPLDADGGANDGQNALELHSAALTPTSTLLRGDFDGAPNRDLPVEIYGYTYGFFGQENGSYLLDEVTLHTDANGHASLSRDEALLKSGNRLTAVVTDLANGDTSETRDVTVEIPPAVFAVGTGRGTVGTAALAELSGAGAHSDLTVVPYGAKFRGGVNVAHADVNHDGIDDLITAPQTGREPVKVFSGLDGSLLASWMAGPPRFAGGVTLAAGDTDGDGVSEIITSVGHGAAPLVTIHDAMTGASKGSFLAFAAASRTGVNLTAGDLDGDGRAEIVASTVSGRAAVHVFHGDGSSASPVFRPFANVGSFGAHVTVFLYNLNEPMLLIGSGEGVRSTVASYTPDGDQWLPALRVGGPHSTAAVSLATIHYGDFGGYDYWAATTALPTIESGADPRYVSGDDLPFFEHLPRGVRLNLG